MLKKNISSAQSVRVDAAAVNPGVQALGTKLTESPSPKPLITADQLRKVCTEMGPIRAGAIANLLCDILPSFKMDTPTRLHEFLATCAVESGEFSTREENLNYSAEGLLKTFKKYFTQKTAAQYARRPVMIANRVYANRMGNGPESSGDGYKNRGGGFIQVTGFDMYAKYGKFIGKSADEARELVRTTDYHAMYSACWVFSIEKKLLDEADANKIVEIRKAINGGLNGYNEYKAYYDRAVKAIR